MFFKRFYDTKLAQASYMIGCQATGEAVVVDPNRDVQQYIDAAKAEKLRITHVTETHIHADFVSGSRELAQRTGAQLFLSDEGDADWKYAFAKEAKARLVKHGDVIAVGNIRLEVVHTPGHTPEHISFMVTDTPSGAGPWGILTGDFVFVGDVGRPDLLERAAGYEGTMEAAAHTLFRSLEWFRSLPDHLQVWPAHGAGSACGKSLGAVPGTTVGYEKIANWGVGTTDENEFVRMVLEGQPEPPRYFAQMKRINKEGPAILNGFAKPKRFGQEELLKRAAAAGASAADAAVGGAAAAHASGDVVVDTRAASKFANGYVRNTINIPLDASFTTWAGWLLPYDRDVYLIVEDDCATCVDDAVRDLAMIGLDRVAGVFASGAVDALVAKGSDVIDTMPQASAQEVAAMLEQGAVHVVDVRGHNEWAAGHLPNVGNIPVGYLSEHIGELPTDRPVVVQCQAGGRSAIAASVLKAHGVSRVINLTGGFNAWRSAGLPVTRNVDD